MKNNNHTGVFIGALLATCVLSGAFAADAPVTPAPAEGTPVDVEVFKGVRVRTGPSGNFYPFKEVDDGREGWVVLNMMIDPKGKPYEVMVVDSSGNSAFERAALVAVNHVGFEPAERAGAPIDSSYTLKMKFAISGMANGASSSFALAYSRFTTAVRDGDRPAADEALGRLRPENLYEEAFANLGKFQYYHRWGTKEQQRHALDRAIAGEEKPVYLPRKNFAGALDARFRLEVVANDYGDALATWALLKPYATPEMRKELQGIVDQLRAAQAGTQRVRRPAKLEESGSWSSTLFRNKFSIVVSSGAVSEIKLRCAQQYLLFKYQPGVEYSIGTKKDQCRVQVVGDPGTTFDLVQ